MAVACDVFGGLLVAGGLLDVFLTVLHYDSRGLLAVRTYRLLWRLARGVTRPLPARPRALLRSMAAPAMVALTIGGWVGVQVVGFGLLYYPALSGGHAFTLGRLPASFLTALYVSAATVTSLSFSDAEPATLGYHWLAAAETVVGLAILSLSVSYLLGLYGVLQSQGVLAARLRHQSRGSNDPRTLFVPHFPGGRPQGLSTLLRELHVALVEHYEGMRRFPLVYYFHTRRPYRAIPYLFWFTGASAAALRWGLPDGHPAAKDPWLPGLIDGFTDVTGKVQRLFLPAAPASRWHRKSSPPSAAAPATWPTG